ncbi:Transcriptional regulator, GntR family domain / Aspartate aminotransferase [Minicystis rosea]|nr:Transcriptional regulator, GntR family domain / Aspartate aminotransferase [Minicystis rosea]
MSRRADLRELPIELDRRDDVPIHKALYDALRTAMLTGRLRPAARLPSSRDLGDQLGVARGTVVAVYEQLVSEGYLETRRGSGTIVAEGLPDRWFKGGALPLLDAPPRTARRSTQLSRWGKELDGSPFPLSTTGNPRPMRPHIPAVDAFPTEAWGRLVAKRARRDDRLWLAGGDTRGYRPLREVLAEHLQVARGVVCSADQIVILPSVQQALDIAARLTIDPGDEVWLEDPGYIGARVVLAAAGATIVPVPVDALGIDVAAGVRLAPEARLAYVTPGHQAPLGFTLTIERRLALLDWARERRALVVEDDYDSEYRYEGRPVPALQGLDRAGVVLHTGTFSKTLLPSLRLAYAVVPDALVDRFVAAKSIFDRFTPPLGQAALADFIEEGHFGRHLRRMREIYAERRAALLSAIEAELGDTLTVVGANAGLDVAVQLPSTMDDRTVERDLAGAGVEAIAISHEALRRRDVNGLLLGFAAFSPARLRKVVATAAATIRATRRRA